MSNAIVSRLKRKKIQEIIQAGKRMDGRGLEDYREMQIKVGNIEKSEGSSEVRLGKTHVIIGVKAGIGTPFDDTPDKGVLMVNAEFTPAAHPTWEPGPPPPAAIELARIVDRGLRSAEILDMKEFALVPGEKVFIIFVDLFILNYDGNLIDACSAGAIAALMNTEIPVYTVKKKKVEDTGEKKKLELRCLPIATTFVKIGDDMILDATADEEEVMDGRVTVTFDDKGHVTTLQKSGAIGFKVEELKKYINTAAEKAAAIRAIATAN